jgi:hypothetical protein
MKKYILSLIGMFAFVFTMAQTPTSSPDIVIQQDDSWGWYAPTSVDSISGATTAEAIFQVLWDERYAFTWFLSGDTLAGGTGNVTIQPQGSYDGVTFENIGSSTTWTYTNGGYDAATQVNTYTEVTAAATDYYSGWFEAVDTFASASGVGIYDMADTATIAERTATITLPGYDYRYIKILCTGASGTLVDLDQFGLKLSPVKL